MTTITYFICDGCGDRVADYDPNLTSWAETDDDEDFCPTCAGAAQQPEALGAQADDARADSPDIAAASARPEGR